VLLPATTCFGLESFEVFEWVSATATIGPSQQEMRIQGVPTVLLTYQDGSLVIDPETVQLPANRVRSCESSTLEQLKCCSLADILRFLRDHPTVLTLRAGLLDLAVRTCNTIHTSKYSFCIELSMKTWQEKGALRVHAHLWLQLKMRTLVWIWVLEPSNMLVFPPTYAVDVCVHFYQTKHDLECQMLAQSWCDCTCSISMCLQQ
jgi:hypothetical protein